MILLPSPFSLKLRKIIRSVWKEVSSKTKKSKVLIHSLKKHQKSVAHFEPFCCFTIASKSIISTSINDNTFLQKTQDNDKIFDFFFWKWSLVVCCTCCWQRPISLSIFDVQSYLNMLFWRILHGSSLFEIFTKFQHLQKHQSKKVKKVIDWKCHFHKELSQE